MLARARVEDVIYYILLPYVVFEANGCFNQNIV